MVSSSEWRFEYRACSGHAFARLRAGTNYLLSACILPRLPRPPALGPIRPRRRSLGRRGYLPRAPGQFAHPGLGAEAAGQQPGERKVDVEAFPVEAEAHAEHF